MSETRFERVLVEDLDLLLPLVRDFYCGEGISYDEARSRKAFLELIENAAWGGVWFVRDQAGCVGYFALTYGFILEFGGRHAVLDELYIRPEFRGRGFGLAALRKAEEICVLGKIAILRLEVERFNERARALYEYLGFAAHDRMTMTKVLG